VIDPPVPKLNTPVVLPKPEPLPVGPPNASVGSPAWLGPATGSPITRSAKNEDAWAQEPAAVVAARAMAFMPRRRCVEEK